MNPIMMDPVHAHSAAPMGFVNGYHQQEYVNVNANINHFNGNGMDNQGLNQNIFHDQRPRHFTPPGHVLTKRDTHIDAHVSGDDYERSCVIYVAGLNANIDEQTFFDTFRQFGNILSCVRRAVDFEMSSSGQQYAFIRYSSPQEAQYAIQCGEIEINGRKMIIKPRDKKGVRSQRQNSHGNSESKQPSSYGSKAGDQILRMINKNHEGQTNRNNNQHFEKQQQYDGRMDFPNSGMKAAASRNQPGSTGPPVFMSKSLTVANIPEEMTPKGLYGLFTEIGPVDGVYIFPMCDQAGRRYGHIVMKSYYYAQKAVEQLHGIHFQGHILDVSYFNGKHVDAVSQTTHRPPVPSMPIGNHQMGPMYGHSQPIPVPQAQGSHFPQQNQPPLGWIQQGMGPASRPFVGMPQYGIPQQPMMPGFNGQTVAYGQQPMDFARYNSPPLPTPSPPGFAVVPDQRYHFNGKQRQRPYGPPPGLGASPARPHGQSISSSEYRSFSDSAASCATMFSSIPTSAQESPKQSIGDRPAEEPKLDMQELDFGSGPVSDSGTTTPPVFKIETAPIIPEVKKPVDPCNLYVKNLDDELVSTSEDLKKVFDPYGQVASAFLAIYPDSKISKGYGFVAFAKAEDASNAKEKLQNTILGKKRVFISWAERKEDRSKRLKWIMDGKKGANPEDEVKEEKSEDSTTANADKGGTKPEVSEEVKSEEHQMSTEVPSDPFSRVTSGEQDSSSPNSIADKVPQEDKAASKDKVENKATQKPVTAPTVGSVKGWHSTPLTGIAEVEEEKSVVKSVEHKPQEGKSRDTDITPTAKFSQSKVSGPSEDKKDPGSTDSKSHSTPGNKRNKKATGSQKASSTQIQTAVPNFRNANSMGRAASSRIPVQGTGTPSKVTPPTGPRLATEANGSNQNASTTGSNPSKKRGYKANRQARTAEKGGSEGASTQKNIVEKKAEKAVVIGTAH